jgi:hypothetical protein
LKSHSVQQCQNFLAESGFLQLSLWETEKWQGFIFET